VSAPGLPTNTFTNQSPTTNAVAMTVILFDTSGLPFFDAAYARDEVAAFVKKTPPATPIAIFNLDESGLQLIQDFTTDPNVLRRAVESRRNAQKPVLPQKQSVPRATPISRFRAAQRDLARYLSAYPGRKNLIWFSGSSTPQIAVGMPGSVFDDTLSRNPDMKNMSDTLKLNNTALYPVDPRGVIFDQDPCTGCQYSGPSHTAGAALTFGEDFESDVLEQGGDNSALAAQTGGKAFYNSNEIRQDVAEIVSAGSHYYTLSYAPTNPDWNGALRKIKVQLTSESLARIASLNPAIQSIGSLHLSYRSGYYAQPGSARGKMVADAAPDIGDTHRLISYSPLGGPGVTTSMATAMSFGAVQPLDIRFQAQVIAASVTKRGGQLPKNNRLAAPWQHSTYREYQILYSIDPKSLEPGSLVAGSQGDAVEVVAVVYDEQGAMANSMKMVVALGPNGQPTGAEAQEGPGLEQTIAIPVHGGFYLRVGVHDLASDRVGALEIPVKSIKFAPQLSASAGGR
jgi:VWFA-related protein